MHCLNFNRKIDSQNALIVRGTRRKRKNSGQEGQKRNRQIIDWTHGTGLVSLSFFYCTIYSSAPFLTSVICHPLKKKFCLFYFHRRERRIYYLHRYKVRKQPSKYLTLIDDAMDQKTTCIPRVRRKTKATYNLATVGSHLVGAIFHSGQSPNGKDVLGLFDYYHWPHDPILTTSVLRCMIVRWCEKYQLPPVLYLQLDNCVRENNNQYILWLLALLVELKIFKKVKSCVLLPAFIREDVL